MVFGTRTVQLEVKAGVLDRITDPVFCPQHQARSVVFKTHSTSPLAADYSSTQGIAKQTV